MKIAQRGADVFSTATPDLLNAETFPATPPPLPMGGFSIVWYQIANVVLALLALASFIALAVLWVIQLVQVIRRQDLKEHKILWILLLLFVPMVGMVAYPFIEGKKKLGIWSVVLMIVPIVCIILFAVARFATSLMSY